MSSRPRRALPATFLGCLALAAGPVPAGAQQPGSLPAGGAPVASPAAPEPRTSLSDIEDEVMCPICGVPLELAIDAPQAQRERAYIRELIAEGRTKEEVKDALVAEFGDEVLAVPSAEGFDLAAWLVPGAAILIAGAAILLALRRWRGEGRRVAADGSRAGTAGAPSAEVRDDDGERRLDADLARYDL